MELSTEFYVDDQGLLREGCVTKTPKEGWDYIKSKMDGDEITGLIGPSTSKKTMIVQTNLFGYLEIIWIIAPSEKWTRDFFILECKLIDDCEVAILNFNNKPAGVIIQQIIRDQMDEYEIDMTLVKELDLKDLI